MPPVAACDEEAADAAGLDDREAGALLRRHLQVKEPNLRFGTDFAVKELSNGTIRKRLGVQVFQITGEVRRHETYVVKDGEVFNIGRAFGGSGVNSLAVADLDGDKRPDLVFSFAWGSGEHRSQVAMFDCLAKVPKQIVGKVSNFTFEDFTVERIDDVTVRVSAGKQVVGTLTLEKKDGEATLEIRLDDNLPRELRDQLRTMP